jgi:hypothetical protein
MIGPITTSFEDQIQHPRWFDFATLTCDFCGVELSGEYPATVHEAIHFGGWQVLAIVGLACCYHCHLELFEENR